MTDQKMQEAFAQGLSEGLTEVVWRITVHVDAVKILQKICSGVEALDIARQYIEDLGGPGTQVEIVAVETSSSAVQAAVGAGDDDVIDAEVVEDE